MKYNGMPNPFGPDETDDHRFVLDEAAFMNDLEPLPAFLVAPSQSYITATEIIPILLTLAGEP